MKKHNVKVTKTVFNRVKRLLARGTAYAVISETFDISKPTIYRIKVSSSIEEYRTAKTKKVKAPVTPAPTRKEPTSAQIMSFLKDVKSSVDAMQESLDKLLGR